MCFLTRFLTHLLFSQKFVFEILLFNFQGSMPAGGLPCDSFAIISHTFHFVNPFFQIFLGFFGFFSLFVKNGKRMSQKSDKSRQIAQTSAAKRRLGISAKRQKANRTVDANAPPIDIHSLRDNFSLKIKNDTRAESTITPPETSGNCTEAGTSLAAKRCR